ncbi:MAG: tRNA modification GTPase MnmE [Candidatus Anoxychlamydiales bacterium]|nr:tRNA modification GTPase MnmE [Candidatus Anoxychlamydiales bacterium]NGX35632.1 tRNA modification GTPase MnmE [Candidatus Anoxychlamydiales bacterium]
MHQKDTISAISTAPGNGAISIVRLSGKDAILIADSIFSKDVKKFKSHSSHVGKIIDDKKNVVDQAIIVVYLTPNSFTGEDIVEIQCHGGSLITQRVFETTIKAGAKIAEAGEFTLRAFLNKKIDLIQAEAIQDLISAKNKFALESAKNHLEGYLSNEIKSFQKEIIDITAIIEASMDFTEEDLEFENANELLNKVQKILKDMQKLSNTFENGKIFKNGLSLCIIGGVNVGKSSLMNAILKKERAIVTKIAGTTRDVIKEDIKLNEMFYQLIDTAGIRKTNNLIEKEGIKRSRDHFKKADLTLLVLDSNKNLDEEDFDLLKEMDENRTIVIWNKIDLKKPSQKIDAKNIAHISAKKRLGLDDLYQMIKNLTFKSNFLNDDIIITKKRHQVALENSIMYLKKAAQGLKDNTTYEFIAADLKSSLLNLSKIIGFDITDDILTSIFSNFCIGK